MLRSLTRSLNPTWNINIILAGVAMTNATTRPDRSISNSISRHRDHRPSRFLSSAFLFLSLLLSLSLSLSLFFSLSLPPVCFLHSRPHAGMRDRLPANDGRN